MTAASLCAATSGPPSARYQPRMADHARSPEGRLYGREFQPNLRKAAPGGDRAPERKLYGDQFQEK